MTDCLKSPALFVGEIDDNINLSLPPASGEEYIKRVVIEARQCSDVVVADMNQTRMKNPMINIGSLIGCIKAPPQLGPTLEWQQYQISDFSCTRLYVNKLKNEIQTCKRKWKAPTDTHFPDTNDQNGWLEFCLKTKEAHLIHPPTLDIVFCLNQPTVEQILEYLVESVETEGKLRHEVGQWIYALLVVLEIPLNPDMCSCLRSLARTCSIIRANNNLEVHEIGGLNLFICLVARYFHQLDLADP